MKQVRSGFLIVSMSILSLAQSGCGGSDRPVLGRVTGSVMMDNQPVAGVAVTFQPDKGRPAIGKTDQNGDFQLMYMPETPGCKVGHCRVEIGYGEGEDEGVEMEGDDVVQTPGDSGKKTIPARYNTETELEADVKPGENVFDFDLRL